MKQCMQDECENKLLYFSKDIWKLFKIYFRIDQMICILVLSSGFSSDIIDLKT